jgi:hypothetical protein
VLYDLLVEIRHSVIHRGSAQEPVVKAWRRCHDKDRVDDAQTLWTDLAGRPLTVDEPDGRIRFSDLEVVGCQRVLDSIAIDLSARLRERISPLDWARLVAAIDGPRHPGMLTDPNRREHKLRACTAKGWGVEIDEATAKQALAEPLT